MERSKLLVLGMISIFVKLMMQEEREKREKGIEGERGNRYACSDSL